MLRQRADMSTYELVPQAADLALPRPPRPAAALPEQLLIRNILWFCRLRWAVVAILAGFGCAGLLLGGLERFGLRGYSLRSLAAAAVLVASNLGFLWHARRLVRSPSAAGARSSLWAQIVSDLAVLTVVVHFAGSLETYIPFAYLFHIVLACIFFSRPASLAVTGIACALYAACVLAEQAGLVPPGGIYVEAAARQAMTRAPWVTALNVGSAMAIWLVVWYLASHLSAMVRQRDNELAETNRRLVEAQQERVKHMLRTTHQLKAPFAAIDANAQLLLKGLCGGLPGEAVEVVERIGARSRRLAAEIQDMLQLANLRSASREPPAPAELDVADVLAWCLAQVEPMAQQRSVAIDSDLRPARAAGVEEHLKMLFTNLLSNAVAYSHEGGRVRVRCAAAGGNGPVVAIEDEGIGIPADKIPRIFEEYYRTDEAVRHNRESSGLGLAIVREVAQAHGLRLRVTSAPEAGSTFEVRFPPHRAPPPETRDKEIPGGLPDDRGRR